MLQTINTTYTRTTSLHLQPNHTKKKKKNKSNECIIGKMTHTRNERNHVCVVNHSPHNIIQMHKSEWSR